MESSDESCLLLVVDDEEEIRLNLCDFMELEGFKAINAENGLQALEYLEKITPDAIMLDLMMPKMGGLELLEELHKREIPIPVIIMTAFGTIDYAVKAMKAGAADFITKPIDYEYLLQVLEKVLKAARLEQKVQQHQKQMEEDLNLAGKIQQSLLPKPINNALMSLNYRFEPMIAIGGDHLLVHSYDQDHIAVTLLDVMGHGISAALVANMLHIELMSRLKEERPPFNVVEHLNRFLSKTMGDSSLFATMIVADVDLYKGVLSVCNVGHPDLLVWKQENKSILPIKSHMAPAGFPENMTGEGMDAKILLASGDRIVFYTDGFPETSGVDGKILGIESFKKIVEQQIHLRPADFLDEVFKSVEEYGTDEPEDDRTQAIIDVK